MAAQESPTVEAGPHPAPGTAAPLAPRLSRRLASALYESLLLFGVVFIAGYLFGTLTQTRNALDNRHALQAFVFVVLGIYFAWFWSRGQTLPMKTWRIRVVDRAGAPLPQWRALLRYLCCWLWFLPPFILMAPFQVPALTQIALAIPWCIAWPLSSALHPERQYWHDVLAGTRLVEQPRA